MNDMSRKIADHARLVATLLLVGTLVLGSAAGVDWLRDYLTSAEDSSPAAGYSIAQAVDESATDDRGGMAPHGQTKAEPSGCCLVPVVLKSDNSNGRFRSANKVTIKTRIVPELWIDHRPMMTSPSRIHSGLGRQFTLVGAHPSGTS